MGRGANFILSSEEKLSLRVVAPFEMRVQNVARTFQVPLKEARRRVANRESKRRIFIKKSFQADVADPLHDDFVINTSRISIEDAVEAISFFWASKNPFHLFRLKIFKIQTSQRHHQHQPVLPNVIILTSNSIKKHFFLFQKTKAYQLIVFYYNYYLF